ncbi:Six-hairpin glycosidase-like protein [Pseudocohnilembus persalinus]|uniref:Six-hairpin glycosidase-like protein n=1 Tax=Pseudocohnilembus persalinus TaxID=266149 RepID=A0A0V0R3M8_PSEPJ|nr:Six-hairpin glycosidase-like protein [Pseudocohnilembus persalinus]|eukprot:KRX09092.1 Six-hairpin glycosidase-like protein [Pseudocohnilembus persalinus]
MTEYHIALEPDGSFDCQPEQIFQLQALDKLSIFLDSKFNQIYRPMLLTGYPRKIGNKIQYPNCEEITQEQILKDPELSYKYNCFEGFWNKEYNWQCDIQIADFNGNFFCQIVFVEINDHVSNPLTLNIRKFGKPCYIIIQPRIFINNQPVLLEQLNVQTQLPYCLGPINRWEDILQNQANLGYNAFHFLSLQTLGSSRHYYSIYDQCTLNKDLIPDNDFDRLAKFIKQVENQMGALSFIDIILAHTSVDSHWLLEIQNCYYTKYNEPLLASALELDIALQKFSDDLSECKIQSYSKGNRVENLQDIDRLIEIMDKEVFQKLKIYEYFQINVKELQKQFRHILKMRKICIPENNSDMDDDDDDVDFFSEDPKIKIIKELQDHLSNEGIHRFGVYINFEILFKQILKNPYSYSIELIDECIVLLQDKCKQKGMEFEQEIKKNIRKQIIWYKIDRSEQEVGKFPNGLLPRYFTKLQNGDYAANSGYIFKDDRQENLAESKELPYLKRNINIWEDLIKLRYGESKKDCPGLWKKMRIYIRKFATIFHGFRLSHASGIPLHVGEYFMRKARNVNNNIIVFAQVFAQNKAKEALFCQRLGINAILRETNKKDTAEDLVKEIIQLNQLNQNTVGSLQSLVKKDIITKTHKSILQPTFPSQIVFDQKHNNQSVLQKHGLKQMLCNLTVHSFASFFKGTVRGYDEMCPYQLSLKDERRLYQVNVQDKQEWIITDEISIGILFKSEINYNNVEIKGSWDNWANSQKLKSIGQHYYYTVIKAPKAIDEFEYKYILDGVWQVDPNKPQKNGNNFYQIENKSIFKKKVYKNFCHARRIMNQYVSKMAQKYPESFIKEYQNNVISIQRQFGTIKDNCSDVNVEITCPGIIDSIKEIFVVYDQDYKLVQDLKQEYIPQGQAEVIKTANITEFAEIRKDEANKQSIIHFFNMPPGLSVVLKCTLETEQLQALYKLNQYFKGYNQSEQVIQYFSDLTPDDITYLLYKCAEEEMAQNNRSTYKIPGTVIPYAGFGGLFYEVQETTKSNELKAELFNNLRAGNWLMDYLLNRIKDRNTPGLKKVYEYLNECFTCIKKLQRYNIPHYFCKLSRQIRLVCQEKMLDHVQLPVEHYMQSSFIRQLLMNSYTFVSHIQITEDFITKSIFSMSAGLPKYSDAPQRMMGRQVFISFKGCLLIPGLYKEAKEIILYFASYLRHGLIPHLLDVKGKPRYNNRDVCWWFIKSIRDYLEFTQDYEILEEKILMKFQSNDQEVHRNRTQLNLKKFMVLQDIIQDIFQSHMNGIKFIEWDSGRYLDEFMDSLGFHINLQYDEKTGFIVGGNAKNALTWMDTIGSSSKGNNKGIPASSRDGAPIELTAILWNCLNFVSELYNQDKYKYEGVIKKNKEELSFEDWAEQIQDNFESNYCVPAFKAKTLGINNTYDKKNKNKIKRRKYGFYKDTIQSSNDEQEYQLRPNACIAISIAPELFSNPLNKDVKKWTLQYLASVELYLIDQQSLGVKTLEKDDKMYVGNYDLVDSNDGKAANGFNLYNGIEFVYLYGFYLKAMMNMNLDSVYNNQRIMGYLTNHKQYIQQNAWQSFPDFTNENGQACKYACDSSPMSVAQIQEVCYELNNNDYLNELKDNVKNLRWKQSSRDMKIFWIRKTSSDQAIQGGAKLPNHMHSKFRQSVMNDRGEILTNQQVQKLQKVSKKQQLQFEQYKMTNKNADLLGKATQAKSGISIKNNLGNNNNKNVHFQDHFEDNSPSIIKPNRAKLAQYFSSGDSGVGKSNLITRFTKDEFNLESKATIGVEFCNKNIKINNQSIKAQVWDTAGQERYRAITSTYYRGAVGAMMVYDTTIKSSFKNLNKWYQELKGLADEDIIVMVVGNKIDLPHMRGVQKEDAEQFCKENGLAYLETSALKNTNVEQAFVQLLTQIYEHRINDTYNEKKQKDKLDTNNNNNIILDKNSDEQDKKKKKEKKDCC